MKYTVKKRFRDKETREIYEPKQVIELTKKRVAEVTAALGDGYIAEVKDEKPKESGKSKSAGKSGGRTTSKRVDTKK